MGGSQTTISIGKASPVMSDASSSASSFIKPTRSSSSALVVVVVFLLCRRAEFVFFPLTLLRVTLGQVTSGICLKLEWRSVSNASWRIFNFDLFTTGSANLFISSDLQRRGAQVCSSSGVAPLEL